MNSKLPSSITKLTFIFEKKWLSIIPIPPSPPDTKLLGTQNKLNDKADVKVPTTNRIAPFKLCF